MTCCRVDDRQRQRFTKAFSSPSVSEIRVKDNHFVLINSMAFEGDDCNMCVDAEVRLQQISESLRCAKVSSFCWILRYMSVMLSVSFCIIILSSINSWQLLVKL